jgi:amino acid transporter
MTTTPSSIDVTAGSGGQLPGLSRSIGFAGALSANVLNMIGVGPFITIPLALTAMGGPQAMLGWLLGAALCACDGLVWAELGSRLPRSGGPYHYLLQAFGPRSLGRLFSFIFLWQTLLIGPLSIASGAVGFADYTTYLAPHLEHWQRATLAAAVCLANTALLYQDVRIVQKVSIIMTITVIGAIIWIIASGAPHFDARRAFDFPAGAFTPNGSFWTGLGSATLIAVYDYGGYNNVCLIGEEVHAPDRTIPRAVLWSIAIVGVLYFGLNLSILGSLPWRAAAHSSAVVADFMRLIHGPWGGSLVACLILIASWGSVLAMLLGYSRVPYAAAADGRFFRAFAILHPRGQFPTLGLLYMGALSALACLFPLADLISVLIVIQTMFQFAAQCIAVILLRRNAVTANGAAADAHAPERVFRMPLFPLPVLVALAGWIYITATSKPVHIAIGILMLLAGTAVFLMQARRQGNWPFQRTLPLLST